MITFQLNGKAVSVDAAPDTPLLWVLRDHLQLTGTKFGCGMGLCGSCTVHVNGEPVRSCMVKVGDVTAGSVVTTIEGLDPGDAHPVQQAWIEHEVPQCGYCQSGQIMQAAALLAVNPEPTSEEIVNHMNGNICRCATYSRVVDAVHRAAQLMREGSTNG